MSDLEKTLEGLADELNNIIDINQTNRDSYIETTEKHQSPQNITSENTISENITPLENISNIKSTQNTTTPTQNTTPPIQNTTPPTQNTTPLTQNNTVSVNNRQSCNSRTNKKTHLVGDSMIIEIGANINSSPYELSFID
eukprot:Pgem_evm1s19251